MHCMNLKARTQNALRNARSTTREMSALVGLDGFVDTIVTPVANRQSQGEDFTAIQTISEFSARIAAAAGKSTNIELYPRMEKAGGNGPIMAGALLNAGVQITYVGALGKPTIHPLFDDFASRADVISLCDPAMTTAVEFDDGKLMLGQLRSLDSVTMSTIATVMGEEAFQTVLSRADLVALVNWTMIPNMTDILRSLANEILPSLTAKPERKYFFDLADPEKRSTKDLLEVLAIITQFEHHGQVTLGLNLKEAQRIHQDMGFADCGENDADLRMMAVNLRAKLGISTVVIHPRKSAACATANGSFWVAGPYVEKPMITTGAGDHFNAGFARGQLLGLEPELCLMLGVCFSGHYVRTACSPTLDDIDRFLTTWANESPAS